MSPVSQVFYWRNSKYWSQKKTQSGNIHSIIYFWKQDWVKGSFWIEVLTIVQLITKNRLRYASGPVQLQRVHYMYNSLLPRWVLLAHGSYLQIWLFHLEADLGCLLRPEQLPSGRGHPQSGFLQKIQQKNSFKKCFIDSSHFRAQGLFVYGKAGLSTF